MGDREDIEFRRQFQAGIDATQQLGSSLIPLLSDNLAKDAVHTEQINRLQQDVQRLENGFEECKKAVAVAKALQKQDGTGRKQSIALFKEWRLLLVALVVAAIEIFRHLSEK